MIVRQYNIRIALPLNLLSKFNHQLRGQGKLLDASLIADGSCGEVGTSLEMLLHARLDMSDYTS